MTNIEQVATQIMDIDFQIGELKEKRDQLAATLIQEIPEGSKVEAGDRLVTIRKGVRRLNNKKLEAQFPATEYPTLYKYALDAAEVKRQVSEAFIEEHELFTVSSPSVVIK